MKSINILIITYNQQDVIKRTLDCVLGQKEHGLKEIVICDDCSKDYTWSILEEYKSRYPSIVCSYRNEHNLGIYANMQRLVSLRGKADLYYFLSGDDMINKGSFQKLQEYIVSNNIELDNKACAIYGDWLRVYPDGRNDYMSNGFVTKDVSALSLKIRGLIYNWGVFLSKALIDSFGDIVLDKGLPLAEGLFDIQTQRYSTKNYHIVYPIGVYSAGIGVSTKLKGNEYIEKELEAWRYFYDLNCFTEEDRHWIRYLICERSIILCGGIRNYFLGLNHYIKSNPQRYGIGFKKQMRVFYIITRLFFSHYYHLIRKK